MIFYLLLIVGIWAVVDLVGRAIRTDVAGYQGLCVVGVLVVLIVLFYGIGAVMGASGI